MSESSDADMLARERRKYEKAWAGPYARNGSPGLAVAPLAAEWARALGADSLMDWGAGDGRAMRRLMGLLPGAEVWGFDLVAVEGGGLGRIHQGPLWNIPAAVPATDFAFSSDVLEHLPSSKIEASLRGIAERTRVGGWIQVCTLPDRAGAEIDEQLHLTVRPGAWWEAEIARFFKVVAVGGSKVSPQFRVRAR